MVQEHSRLCAHPSVTRRDRGAAGFVSSLSKVMSRRTRTKSTRTYRRVVLQQCEQHRTILVPRRDPAHNLAAAPMPTTPIARRRTNLPRKKTLGILNAGTKYCTWRVHTTQNGRQGSDPPYAHRGQTAVKAQSHRGQTPESSGSSRTKSRLHCAGAYSCTS